MVAIASGRTAEEDGGTPAGTASGTRIPGQVLANDAITDLAIVDVERDGLRPTDFQPTLRSAADHSRPADRRQPGRPFGEID